MILNVLGIVAGIIVIGAVILGLILAITTAILDTDAETDLSPRDYYERINNLITAKQYDLAEELYKEYRKKYPKRKK